MLADGVRARVQCAGLPACSGLRTALANVPCGWVKSASARGGLVRSLFAGLDGKAFEVMEVAGAEAWLEG